MLLAGRGPDEKAIDQKIAELGLTGCARRIGHQTDSRVLDGLYQRAALLVFPSLYDNAPMVVREAAAMGTPAVMIRGSSAAEVIADGENGYLCDNEAWDLEKTIVKALQNPDELQRVGEKARETIPVSWETIMEYAVERYEKLIALNRAGKLPKKNSRFV